VTAAQDALNGAIWNGDEAQAIAILESQPALGMRATAAVDSAAYGGAAAQPAACGMLLDHGTDVNRRGPGDRTPLDLADGTGWRKAGGLEKYRPSRSARQRGLVDGPLGGGLG